MAERIGIDELGRTAEKVRKRVEGYADGYISFPNCLRALERLDDVTTKATAELRSHRERELSGGWTLVSSGDRPAEGAFCAVQFSDGSVGSALADSGFHFFKPMREDTALPGKVVAFFVIPPAPEVTK